MARVRLRDARFRDPAARVEDVHLHGRAHIVVHGKGGKTRVVPLPGAVRGWLAATLLRRAQAGPLVEGRDHEGQPNGRAMLPATVSVAFGRWLRANGFEGVSAHPLRHTYATELLAADQGRNLRAVSRLLGHADTRVTERVYTCGYDADAWAAVALLPDPTRST